MKQRRGPERDEAKERFWRQVVEGYDPKQATIRQWCAKHHVSEPSFYAWRRELARRDRRTSRSQAKCASLVAVHIEPAAPPSAANSASSKVTIRLARGLRLKISLAQLAQTLDVLEARGC